jgi:coenzyme F420-reducing hydrogenase beta subunit
MFMSGARLHCRTESSFAVDVKNFCATFPAMSDHIAYRTVGADTYKVLLSVHQHLAKVFPDVWLRASQINGCAFCLDTHANEADISVNLTAAIAMINTWNRLSVAFRSQLAERKLVRWRYDICVRRAISKQYEKDTCQFEN